MNSADDGPLYESTDSYDVWWKREGEDETFYCSELEPLTLVRRLIGANHNFGEITIVKVERS